MRKKIPVLFHFLRPCTLSNREGLKKFILSVFKREKRVLEKLDIIFCDDEYLFGLNCQFLQHDFYTDILSFRLSAAKEPLIAEIYISVDRVHENALNNAASFKQELHRVIFHGVLHFCGYKDKSNADKETMRSMEEKYLKVYF